MVSVSLDDDDVWVMVAAVRRAHNLETSYVGACVTKEIGILLELNVGWGPGFNF